MFECAVYAHVYAQTVHTCAAHEKMFISYMDIQTCKARRLHHYTCTVGEVPEGCGGSHYDLEQTSAYFSSSSTHHQLWQVFLKVGPSYLDLLRLPAVGTVGPGGRLGSQARLLSQA